MVIAANGRTEALTVDYDEHADVLYIALGQPRPGYGADGPDDVILRYGETDHQPSGVTVVGFRANVWLGKVCELAAIISDHAGVPVAEAKQAIYAARPG